MMFARKILFLPNLWGNWPSFSPVSYAYDPIRNELSAQYDTTRSSPSLRPSLRKNGNFSVFIRWTVFVLRFSDRWLGRRAKFWQNWSILCRDWPITISQCWSNTCQTSESSESSRDVRRSGLVPPPQLAPPQSTNSQHTHHHNNTTNHLVVIT